MAIHQTILTLLHQTQILRLWQVSPFQQLAEQVAPEASFRFQLYAFCFGVAEYLYAYVAADSYVEPL